MKYSKESYEEMNNYGDDEGVTCYSQKIVKTRKEHECYNCEKIIKTGEHALCEKYFFEGFPESTYTCIPCCDAWLDEDNPELEAAK